MSELTIRLAVLNPKGRDPEQEYPAGVLIPTPSLHPPINYHAYAFCTGGGFYRDAERIPDKIAAVLIILRKDFSQAHKALQLLKEKGKHCFLSFKESGSHQVANALSRPGQWTELNGLFQVADGAMASTQDLIPLYQSAGARIAEFFPTPYPVDLEAWNFTCSSKKRSGVFLGTREFGVPSRQHVAALHTACFVAGKFGRYVTLIDDRSCPGRLRKELTRSYPQLRWIPGPLPYPDYLRVLAAHEVVFQMDGSKVPGQVAGDCTLARVLCIGGDGAIERIVFPSTCGFARNHGELTSLLEQSLRNPEWRRGEESAAKQLAGERISFQQGAANLQKFFLETRTLSFLKTDPDQNGTD